MARPVIAPGIYFGLPEDDYFAADGLSCSGMKHLAVSPLNYWHQNLNPAREWAEETYPQRWGKAVHCRLLEPERFAECYAAELSKADHPNALVTDDDLKGWLAERGLPTGGKRKLDRIDRIRKSGEPVVIWDELTADHAAVTRGRILMSAAEMARLDRLAAVAAADPYIPTVLSGGVAEVSFFVRDPETGVTFKARMDYPKIAATIDLKTFSNARGKPTDRAVFEAIYYEGYYLQAVVYHTIRELARRQLASGEIAAHGAIDPSWLRAFAAQEHHGFGFVFIESCEPFDTRVIQLRRSEFAGADPNVYWNAAEMRMADLTRLYAECCERYGDSPWRVPAKPHVLLDTDLPQLLFN